MFLTVFGGFWWFFDGFWWFLIIFPTIMHCQSNKPLVLACRHHCLQWWWSSRKTWWSSRRTWWSSWRTWWSSWRTCKSQSILSACLSSLNRAQWGKHVKKTFFEGNVWLFSTFCVFKYFFLFGSFLNYPCIQILVFLFSKESIRRQLSLNFLHFVCFQIFILIQWGKHMNTTFFEGNKTTKFWTS